MSKVPLGIKVYHLMESPDWPMILGIFDTVIERETKKLFDMEEDEARLKQMDLIKTYKEFIAKFKTIMHNSNEKPLNQDNSNV